MVVVAHFSTPLQTELTGKMTENKNKIPQYAKEYRNEYLFVRGINETCGKFLRVLDKEEKVAEGFDTPQAKRLMLWFRKFLKAQEFGYLKDTTEFYFEESDANYIDQLETTVADYFDLYYDVGSYQFNQEKYDNDYPSLREFHECFERFKKKINIREKTYEEFMSEVRAMKFDQNIFSDSDSDSDSGDFEIILHDSDSDSDSGDYVYVLHGSDNDSDSD